MEAFVARYAPDLAVGDAYALDTDAHLARPRAPQARDPGARLEPPPGPPSPVDDPPYRAESSSSLPSPSPSVRIHEAGAPVARHRRVRFYEPLPSYAAERPRHRRAHPRPLGPATGSVSAARRQSGGHGGGGGGRRGGVVDSVRATIEGVASDLQRWRDLPTSPDPLRRLQWVLGRDRRPVYLGLVLVAVLLALVLVAMGLSQVCARRRPPPLPRSSSTPALPSPSAAVVFVPVDSGW